MKILFALGHPGVPAYIKKKLHSNGHDILLTDSKVIANIENYNPDLIITDCMNSTASLALVNGIKHGQYKTTPVIILSLTGQENLVEQAFELGADDYMTQPLNYSELDLRMKILVKWGSKHLA